MTSAQLACAGHIRGEIIKTSSAQATSIIALGSCGQQEAKWRACRGSMRSRSSNTAAAAAPSKPGPLPRQSGGASCNQARQALAKQGWHWLQCFLAVACASLFQQQQLCYSYYTNKCRYRCASDVGYWGKFREINLVTARAISWQLCICVCESRHGHGRHSVKPDSSQVLP